MCELRPVFPIKVNGTWFVAVLHVYSAPKYICCVTIALSVSYCTSDYRTALGIYHTSQYANPQKLRVDSEPAVFFL